MKMSFGSRFMGCEVDSRERSFGKTFFSSALLIPVICKRARQSGTVTKIGVEQIFTHLGNPQTNVRVPSKHSASILRQLIAVRSRLRVPGVVDVLVQLLFQQSEELGHRVGIIRVDCYHL